MVFLNNGTAAMIVFLTNPPGIELYYHVNVCLYFNGKKQGYLLIA